MKPRRGQRTHEPAQPRVIETVGRVKDPLAVAGLDLDLGGAVDGQPIGLRIPVPSEELRVPDAQARARFVGVAIPPDLPEPDAKHDAPAQ